MSLCLPLPLLFLGLCLSFAPALIRTIRARPRAYDAAIRNWQSAHSVTDAVALIALYIVWSCLVQREPARYFIADNSSPARAGRVCPKCAVYIPAVITNAFYTPANIAGRSRGLDRRRRYYISVCVCIHVYVCIPVPRQGRSRRIVVLLSVPRTQKPPLSGHAGNSAEKRKYARETCFRTILFLFNQVFIIEIFLPYLFEYSNLPELFDR